MQLANPILLNKIDSLFATGVGEHVSLPQLVVVGDQSSGKSSVLEGLSNLPFPRDSGLCTRFATQIIFRRSAQSDMAVSVIPDSRASPEHIAAMKAWKKTGITELSATMFSEIMTEVIVPSMSFASLTYKGASCNGTEQSRVSRTTKSIFK
jgi:GTPase SAR1 family protein